MSRHGIEWLNRPGTIGRSWNPITGCSHVSPGCEHCYAESISSRFGFSKKPWTAANAPENLVLHDERLTAPLGWKKPSTVFVNSMSDLFHDLVPDDFIDAVFAVMAACQEHTFIVLTKRANRMKAYLNNCRRRDNVEMAGEKLKPSRPPAHWYHVSDWSLRLAKWPLPNVWLGVSAEDQQRWNERVPDLIRTLAAVRVVSAEPLLGSIDPRITVDADDRWIPLRGHISWLIIGGESGAGARPCDIAWIRTLTEQAQAHGVKTFIKQLGARPIGDWLHGDPPGYWLARRENGAWRLNDRKGADPDEWPEDLRVQEWPAAAVMEVN